MLFKVVLFLVSLLSILQVWHTSILASIFAKPVLRVGDYQFFSDVSKTIVLWIGLLLFASSFLFFKKTDKKTLGPSSFHWLGSFVLVIGLVIGPILAVNPDGRFPWNERDTYVTIAAHSIKPNLYAKLKNTPDVLMFGSSVSFTTPADYFPKKWNVSAFNMALNGGGPIDFVDTMNYVIQKSPDEKMPSTVLVEILSPSLRISNPNQTPVKLIPYMSSFAKRLLAVGASADSLVRISSFADTIFTMLFIDTERWQIWVKFTADGTGVRNVVPTQAYKNAVKKDVRFMKGILSCRILDAEGKEYIEKLVSLSKKYKFGLVFYRTPVNADFYTLSKTNPERYAKCQDMLDTYMQTLTQENPNVFYRNLSTYEKISAMTENGFTDGHHLKREAATLILDALDNEITSALQWAKTNRK
jgi:hypothetical protein